MSDLGTKLRTARERRGVSLRDIAARTKISVIALESLERNDPTRLPGGIFARSIVRSYASEVGLDPDTTVAEFIARFNLEPLPTPTEAVNLAGSAHRVPGMVVKILVASLVLVAILLLLTLAGADSQSATPTPDRRSSRTTSPGSGQADPPAGLKT
ncbi:MAG: helix-turn-helix domain-containing protein [Vicinamibacterales bacterium]